MAQCEGWDADKYMRSPYIRKGVGGVVIGIQVPYDREYIWFRPSTDWAIIHRELIRLSNDGPNLHNAYLPHHQGYWAVTPLIAAMRCYVASKLGNTVKVPLSLMS